MEKRLKDYVVEGDHVELKKKLDEIIEKSNVISYWIEKNKSRDVKSIALNNLLKSTSHYIEVMSSSLESHISILALSTRNIYEINVRIRSLIENEEELGKWLSESTTDKVQTLEGILLLTNDMENINEQNILQQEVIRLTGLINKYGLPIVKQPVSTGNLVKKVGLEEEHKSLFKLYSKLVHPTSYLINDFDGASSVLNQKILQIHAQLYAHDSINRVCLNLEIPYEVSSPYGQI